MEGFSRDSNVLYAYMSTYYAYYYAGILDRGLLWKLIYHMFYVLLASYR